MLEQKKGDLGNGYKFVASYHENEGPTPASWDAYILDEDDNVVASQWLPETKVGQYREDEADAWIEKQKFIFSLPENEGRI